MNRYANLPAERYPLDAGLNAAVLHMAGRLFPTGFDVSEDAPDTFEKLVDHVRRRRRLTVWSGGSADTIFGNPEVNYAFRAWHDWCHLNGRHDFTLAGEMAAVEMQCEHLLTVYGQSSKTREWCRILRAEVIGQALYLERHGDFPERQRDFVSAYLDNQERALGDPQFLAKRRAEEPSRAAAVPVPPAHMAEVRSWATALPVNA